MMPCKRKKPVFKSKKAAEKHGAITYGSGKHREYKVKGGWSSTKK